MDLNEFLTRRDKIDVALKEQGWDIKKKNQIIIEVDTKQSDFKKNQYKFVLGKHKKNGKEHQCYYFYEK